MSAPSRNNLFRAVASGDCATIERVMAAGIPIHIQEGSSGESLYKAAERGDYALIKYLVEEAGARVNIPYYINQMITSQDNVQREIGLYLVGMGTEYPVSVAQAYSTYSQLNQLPIDCMTRDKILLGKGYIEKARKHICKADNDRKGRALIWAYRLYCQRNRHDVVPLLNQFTDTLHIQDCVLPAFSKALRENDMATKTCQYIIYAYAQHIGAYRDRETGNTILHDLACYIEAPLSSVVASAYHIGYKKTLRSDIQNTKNYAGDTPIALMTRNGHLQQKHILQQYNVVSRIPRPENPDSSIPPEIAYYIMQFAAGKDNVPASPRRYQRICCPLM